MALDVIAYVSMNLNHYIRSYEIFRLASWAATATHKLIKLHPPITPPPASFG